MRHGTAITAAAATSADGTGGRSAMVENRPGANAHIGTEIAARATREIRNAGVKIE